MLDEPLSQQRGPAARAQSSPELLAAIRGRQWTSHNIPLSPGESTMGPAIPLIGDDERTTTIKALVHRRFDRSPLRVLDLGAHEGGLSLEMAREGWQVSGIEGRRSNFEKAELVRAYHDLPNLRFELRDVKTLDRARDGEFDVVLCCGLLYHLDQPFAFLSQLATITAPDGMLFLDTHVAPDDVALSQAAHRAQLSAVTSLEHAGHVYEGRWFTEPQEGSVYEREWSAVSNERSFWPSRRALIRGVYHAGFHAISELFGMWEIDREFGLRDQFSRLYLACQRRW